MNYQSPYFPNFYQPQQQQYQYQQPFQNSPFQQQQPAAQNCYLNGKIVDSVDVVRVTEVPMGGYGVFPKADLSEVYVKTWNNDGTTKVISYVPAPTNKCYVMSWCMPACFHTVCV